MNEYIYAILVSSSAIVILSIFLIKNFLELKKQELKSQKHEKKA